MRLIKEGKAYVDEQTSEQIAQQKGTPTQPGVASPYRDRPVEENLAQYLEHEIARYKDVPSPAIILIPGREGPLGLGQSALKAAVEKAVGIDIL